MLVSSGPPAPGFAALRPDASGFVWLDREGFARYFAPDVGRTRALVLAAAQKPIAVSSFTDEEPFGVPIWKSLPSWYLVAQNDQTTITELKSSHVAMFSHPDEVAKLIETAAMTVPVRRQADPNACRKPGALRRSWLACAVLAGAPPYDLCSDPVTQPGPGSE